MTFYSIIIPTFNSENTIQKCIESVVNQCYTNFEVIVYDCASTDNTVQIIKNFADERIKIYSEPDKGTYDAMNKAIDRANGKWLYFLGSDDLFFNSEVLQVVKNYLDATDAYLVYGSVMISGDSHWAKDGEIYRGETPLAALFEQNISHQSIFYFRRIFDEQVRYNLNYRVCADYDLNLYCASKYKIEYIPIIISLFRVGGASSVNSDDAFATEKWLNIVTYFRERLFEENLINSKGGIKKAWKRFLGRFQFGLAFLSIKIYVYHALKRSRSGQ